MREGGCDLQPFVRVSERSQTHRLDARLRQTGQFSRDGQLMVMPIQRDSGLVSR